MKFRIRYSVIDVREITIVAPDAETAFQRWNDRDCLDGIRRFIDLTELPKEDTL